MTHIELTCIYVRNYNKMLQVRERTGKLIGTDELNQFEQAVREQISSNT